MKPSEERQQQCEDLRRCLNAYDTGELLDLFKAQANCHFDGRYTIFLNANHFKAAFCTPGFDVDGRGDLECLPEFVTLRDAVIDAIVAVRTFYQEADRDGIRRQLLERIQGTK